jgi:hypothetical protein
MMTFLMLQVNIFLNVEIEDKEKRFKTLKEKIDQLPKKNKTVLGTFCLGLYKISLSEEKNKMGIENLSTVFGMNFMAQKDENVTKLVNATKYINKVGELMILYSHELFIEKKKLDLEHIEKKKENEKINEEALEISKKLLEKIKYKEDSNKIISQSRKSLGVWTEIYDKQLAKYYYHHPFTGTVSWLHPKEHSEIETEKEFESMKSILKKKNL